ncbi:MAG: EAL domain-containing protein [Betaproteobacteria bacterium]|nr:EAL domain-containing protein [Betaproteobacteria bacterium]
MDFWLNLSVRTRLILLFVLITVLPLALLVWVARQQTQKTVDDLGSLLERVVYTANQTIRSIGKDVSDGAVNALDARARDEIERLTTDTANRVAEFLYGRDADIRYIATLTPDATLYRNFIEQKQRRLVSHGKWNLNADQSDWEPETPVIQGISHAEPGSVDNATYFHHRPYIDLHSEEKPLYLEITFVGLDGQEIIKATTSRQVSAGLKNVSQRRNTYARAETYFAELKKLKPGEIYVSNVIGHYVGSKIIGKFTPSAAQNRGIPFEPEKHAYAGRENPVGRRFEGIVRWATPVMRDGKITGYVTLALNHDHLMSFTDTISPTEERYRDINDAFSGNYAFIWDSKGRSIAHPRHHSIVGYDEDGNPEIPWLEDRVYEDWQRSGKPWHEFMQTAPTFVDQLQKRKPARLLTEEGKVGLDCRWLNFAPQCIGWHNLTKSGGSGSFLILWSSLWKLTTAAAIPYYTGQYNPTVQGNLSGFGFVTIGMDIDYFRKAATATQEHIILVSEKANNELLRQGSEAEEKLHNDMKQTIARLTFSTIFLIFLAIIIAVLASAFLSQKINWLNDGMRRFRAGEKNFRFTLKHRDEIASLADNFNEMAETLNQKITELERTLVERGKTERELLDIKEHLEARIAERTRELSREVETRRAAEEKAQHMAAHDPLTGLANRMLFNEQLQKAISRIERSGQCGALLFLDLDRFKSINDTFGHTVGDGLLIHMANIFRERVRKSDTSARLGGDEFAIIMAEIDCPEHASILAQSILEKLNDPVHISGYEIQPSVSIGIATFRNTSPPPSVEGVTYNADLAMYQAKAQGGMCYCFFEESLQEKVFTRQYLSEELATAADRQQFLPYFQPLYQTAKRCVPYLEVFARWNHPVRGLLMPSSFMEIAMHSGIIRKIDEQVFEAACLYAKKWKDEGLAFGRLSFNIIQQYLEDPDFATNIGKVLEQLDFPPQQIAFEIPEYAFLKDSEQTARNIHTLRSMGIAMLVDHLEVESSRLKNLIDYPLDAIKINLAFTEHISDATISAIAALASNMHFALIAECVENERQWNFSQSLNCEIIQGYKHARPMDAEETLLYLREHSV